MGDCKVMDFCINTCVCAKKVVLLQRNNKPNYKYE